jgi:hypothetical protein
MAQANMLVIIIAFYRQMHLLPRPEGSTLQM